MDRVAGVLLIALCACSSPKLVSVAIAPATPTLAVGATAQLGASGTYSDGTTQPLDGVAWSSSDLATATVASGQGGAEAVTGVAFGTVTITATAGGVSGTTSIAIVPQVYVDASQRGATIGKVVGARSPDYEADYTDPSYVPAFESIPVALTSFGDDGYHWQNKVGCSPGTSPGIPPGEMGTQFGSNGDIDHFMTLFAQPTGADVMVYVPIGTNPTCDGRGDPAEGAAMVDYANNQQHYGIKYWQLGYSPDADDNGDFGGPPYIADTPSLYASIANQYIAAMKAKDPTIKVGVALAPQRGDGPPGPPWDATVLANVPGADFVTTWMHADIYPMNPSDQELVTTSVDNVHQVIANLQGDLVAAGRPDVPVIISDLSGNSAQMATQQVLSITAALYFGQALAEVAVAGASAIGPFGIQGCDGVVTPAPGEYGFQSFLAHGLMTHALPDPACPDAPSVPEGTILPIGRAYQLAAQFAKPGEAALGVAVGGQPSVRAYAATHGAGLALFLFNLDENAAAMPSLGVTGTAATSFDATAVTYGKAEYDQTQQNVWAPPTTQALGTVTSPFTVTLPPWSMTVLTLTPR